MTKLSTILTLTIALLWLSTNFHAQGHQFDWAAGFGSTGLDEGKSVTTDNEGNIYTTGSFQGTVDFDPGIGVYNLTSNGDYDIYISILDSTGNLLMAKNIGGTYHDEAYSIVRDDYGNIYTTGSFQGTVDFFPGLGVYNLNSNGASDIFILKLNDAGNFVWAINMGGNGSDEALSIGLGAFGDVYTVGYFNDSADFDPGIGVYNLTSNGGTDIFVSKLDPSGNFIWAKNLGGSADEQGLSIAIDANGNAYTTGWFEGTVDFDPGPTVYNLTSNGGTDIFISKLSFSGNFIWAKNIGGTSDDYGNFIAYDFTGNVYTTGCFQNTADFNPVSGGGNLTSFGGCDIFLLKLNENGNYAWAKNMGGNSHDEGCSIALDGLGNIYTSGCFNDTADFDPGPNGGYHLSSFGNSDIFITKITDNGNFFWAKSTGGNADECAFSVALDYSKNIIATGSFSGIADFDPGPGLNNLTSLGGKDAFVLRLQKSPTLLANFTASNTQVFVNDTIQFSDLSTGNPTSWLWNFGDGTTETMQNPQYLYQTPGIYTVSLVVSDGTNSNTLIMTDYINVQPVTNPFSCGDQITDYDGNQYYTVQIGNQCWMKENLKVTSNLAGNSIVRHCYNNIPGNCDTYGGLYDWDTMMDGATSSNSNPSGVQGICPPGWHVPSDSEWTELTDSLGGTSIAGGKLKESGTAHWNSPNAGATNSSGFTALPGGLRLSGSFYSLGSYGYWWTATQSSVPSAWYRDMHRSSENVNRDYHPKLNAFSVRCLMDNVVFGDLTITTIDVSCNGSSNGSADLTVLGGIPPYTFAWSNGESTEDISGLAAGTYSVTVIDAGAMIIDTIITISEPDEIFFTEIISDVSIQGGSDGAIDITVTGGTTPYSFLWGNGETTEDISGLVAGTYIVDVTDGNGCDTSGVFEITEFILCAPAIAISPDTIDFGTVVIDTIPETLSAWISNSGNCGLDIDTLFGLQQPFMLDTATLNLQGFGNLGGLLPPGDSLQIPVILDKDYTAAAYTDTLHITSNAIQNINLDSGLIAYFPFNGNAIDESYNWNDGTVNGASLVSDRFGNLNSAYNFDGVDDYIHIGYHSYSTYTISLWMKSSQNTFPEGGSNLFSSELARHIIRMDNSGTIHYSDNPISVNDNIWHHIVICVSLQDTVCYIDNTSGSYNSPYAGTFTGNTVLGKDYPYVSYYSGIIDDVRIYNRALSVTEIQALYYEGTGSLNHVIVQAELTNTLLPEIYVFASSMSEWIDCGSSPVLTVQIGNSGTDILDVNIIPPFSGLYLSDSALSIAPGDLVSIGLSCDPALPSGTYSGNFEIHSNDYSNTPVLIEYNLTLQCGTCDLSTTSIGFGDVVEGFTATETVTILNSGNEPLEVLSMSITGSAFSIVAPFTGIIQVGDSLNVDINFNPGFVGNFSEVLTIVSDTISPCSEILLSGTGVDSILSWELICSNHNFGPTDINTGATTSCTVHNTGTLPLNIIDCFITDSAFSFAACSFVVDAGSSQNVVLSFDPTQIGQYSGEVGFTDDAVNTHSVMVSGWGYYQSQAPDISFSTVSPFSGTTGVSPTSGPSNTYFEYQIVYADADNNPPMAGYPKLGIDNNADTDFTDPMDKIISLSELDPTDSNYIDGKTYVYITSLGLGNHGYQYFTYDSLGNIATSTDTAYVSGPMVSNDLLDLSIFANDIIFSDPSPVVGQQITITANIHNYSDFLAENVKVWFVIKDTIVDSTIISAIQPQTSTSVSIQHYFSYWDYYPVKVWVDPLDSILEDNELNNFAIRPITVGNVPLPQILFTSTGLYPSVVDAGTGAIVHYYGQVEYDLPDGNQPCQGATVTMTIQQTGQSFTTYSVLGGYFDIYFPAPSQSGSYTINATVTDYTLTGQSGDDTLTVDPIPIPQYIDLKIDYYWMSWSSGCSVIGNPVSINGYFTNAGNLPASNFYVYYYVDNVVSDTIFVSYLGAGQNMPIGKSMTFNTTGPHSFAVSLDPTHVVAESNEANNYLSKGKNIYPPGPDLAPTDIVFSDNSPYVAQTINLLFNISNLQCDPSTATTALIEDITTGDTLAILNLGTVAGLLHNTIALSHSFASTGYHEIKITVDPNNIVSETNETNQELIESIYVEPSLPELSTLNIFVANPNALPGDLIRAGSIIRNTGNSTAYEFYVSFDVDGTNVDSVWIDSLLAYDSRIVLSGLFVRDSCPQLVDVFADADNTVYELNELNNFKSEEIGYDLYAKRYHIGNSGSNPAHIIIGSTFNAKSYVRNEGEFTCTSIPVSYFADGVYIGTDVVPVVATGGEVISQINHQFQTLGTHEILVKVDFIPPDSTFFCESDETNNSHIIYILVKEPVCDLAVYSQHISPSVINPDPGDTVEITSSFLNIGSLDAGPFWAGFRINNVAHGDSVYIPGLAAYEDSSFACTIPYIPGSIGTDVITVELDINNMLIEESKTNNIADRALVVGLAPDFTFLDPCLIISVPEPDIGSYVMFYPKVFNEGNEAGSATIHLYSIIGFDTTFIGATYFFLGANSALAYPIYVPWIATGTSGEIFAEITSVSPQEYNRYNNTCSIEFGNPEFDVWLTASDSIVCPDQLVTISAHTQGGSGNYSYHWYADGIVPLQFGPDPFLETTFIANTTIMAIVSDGLSYITRYIDIAVYPQTLLDDVVSPITCNGYGDGEIDTQASGASTPFSFLWSNGETTEDIASLSAGTYSVTVSDVNGCQVSNVYIITQPMPMSISGIVTDVSCYGGSDGAIVQTVTGGTTPYAFTWSNGQTNESFAYFSSGNYEVTVSDANACPANASYFVDQPLALSATVLVTDAYTISSSDGAIDLTVQGGIPPNTYSWSNGATSEDISNLSVGTYVVTVEDANLCVLTQSAIVGYTYDTQTISLSSGWSLFSTYIEPVYPLFDSVLADIVSNVILVKNSAGAVFWPYFNNLNQIGNWIVCEGYQVNMANPDIISIVGLAVQPQNTICNIIVGWSIIPYLRNVPGAIDIMLSSIENSVIIVKDSYGSVYWPTFNLDLIGTMYPGQGYLVNAWAPCNLVYPANPLNTLKFSYVYDRPEFNASLKNTGNNMTLGLIHDGIGINPGDEISVYSQSGLLVGLGSATDEFTSISLWGDDETTPEIDGLQEGEEFTVKLINGSEISIDTEDWLEGDDTYGINKISVARLNQSSVIDGESFVLYQNSPNPFGEETEFSFYLPKSCKVEFALYNVLGDRVVVLVDGEMPQGKQIISFNCVSLRAGTYFYRLRTKAFEQTKKMVVIQK